MTKFTLITWLLLWASTCQGADDCLKQCTDFCSGDCKGATVGNPLRWTVNDILVSEGSTDISLSQLRYDNDGLWIQNITVHNVCEPVEIRCLELQQELQLYSITFCEGSSNEVDTGNLTVNSTSEVQPPPDKSYIAACVLVVPAIIVAPRAVVMIVLLILCLRRRRNHPPPHTPPPPPTSDGSADDDLPETDGDSHNETTLTEAVPPNETSGSSLARRTAIPFKGPPKLDVSRDKVVIELDVDDSASEPATYIKPQVDLCQENADVQNVASVVEQCSDTHGLIPAWYYGNKINVSDFPSRGNVAYYVPPQSIPGQEGVSIV